MPSTKRTPRKKPSTRPPVPAHELIMPGNDDPELTAGGVAITLDSDGIAGFRPVAFDRMSPDRKLLAGELIKLVGQQRHLARELESLVIHMRDHGVSWQVIGWCVGTSGEAARQRWGDSA